MEIIEIPEMLWSVMQSLIHHQYVLFTATGLFSLWCGAVAVYMVFRFIIMPLSKGKV